MIDSFFHSLLGQGLLLLAAGALLYGFVKWILG